MFSIFLIGNDWRVRPVYPLLLLIFFPLRFSWKLLFIIHNLDVFQEGNYLWILPNVSRGEPLIQLRPQNIQEVR